MTTKEFKIISASAEETQKIAHKIAPFFRAGDIIVLDGDLGAGKSCFVKGFAQGLESKDLVTSPTFSIANFYRTPTVHILHIDLYRISTMEEFTDLGIMDYFDDSIVLIEWGKKFADSFDSHFMVSFTIDDDHTRTLTFSAQGGESC